jgi:hypothetical protein
MELYIFDICFSSQDRLTDIELLSDFLNLLAGRDLVGDGMTEIRSTYRYVLPSEAGRVALLSAVVNVDDRALSEQVAVAIGEELARSVAAVGFADTPFCMSYVSVLQDGLKDAMEDRPGIETALATVHIDAPSAAIGDRLQSVAAARQALLVYAQQVAKCILPADTVTVTEADGARLAWLTSAVGPVLAAASGAGAGQLRSMRMYFLKILERLRGVSFVRSAMQQAPLQGSAWLGEWIELKETGLVRFMGANKLPQYNPLAADELVGPATGALAAYLGTGQFVALEAFARAHATHPRLGGALCCALFHEVGLLHVLPNALNEETAARADRLAEWIEASDALPLEAAERRLLLFCTQRPLGHGQDPGAFAFFRLDTASNPEKIVVVRLLVHLAAAAMGAAPTDVLGLFRRALFSPAELAGTYFPTMASDPLYMAMQALMAAGDDRGANRWYTCANGHPFAIGACGGAMEESTCPACGAKIGGMDHKLNESNKVIGKTTGGDDAALFQKTILEDKSDKNYCLRSAAEEADKHFACRGLDTRSVRALRVLLHGSMAIGLCIGGEAYWAALQTAVNPAYTKAEAIASPAGFVLDHLRQDLAILLELTDKREDQLALLLHRAILLATGADPDEDEAEAAADTDASPSAARVELEPAAPTHPPPDAVDVAVTLAPGYADHSDAGDGPLRPGEVGMIIQYGGQTGRRFNVRAMNGSASTWWYDTEALLLGGAAGAAGAAGAGAVADAAGHPVENQLGIRVVLAPGYEGEQDAAEGPLRPGDAGEVVEYKQRDGHQWHVRAPDGRTWWYSTRALHVQDRGGGQRLAVPAALQTTEERVKWEGVVHGGLLADLLADDGLADRLRALEARYSGSADEGAVFQEELLERLELASLGSAQRAGGLPGLWGYKRAFSFAHFAASLSRSEHLPEQYPVLSAFLEKQTQLRALRHLPQFFKWLGLLMERYDKRLDKAAGREMAVGDALAGASEGARPAWAAAFAGFKSAWDLSWHAVGRHGCLTIPRDFLSLEQALTTKLCFSFPGQTDEGICPNALADYLIRLHNDTVARVDQVLLMRGQDVQRHATRKNEISSRFMQPAHSLTFDTEHEVEPYVHKHCVHHSSAGELVYDFEAAEQFVVDRYFYNKPLINLRLPGFSYADAESASRSVSLKDRVPQVIPHHETFSTTIQPPYSSTKG